MLAEGQAGFLTARQARELGVDRDALAYHVRPGGRLERTARGLYRLRFFPRSPFDHAAAAWVASGPDESVISHESALELYELSDVIPDEVHLTLSASDAAGARGMASGCIARARICARRRSARCTGCA